VTRYPAPRLLVSVDRTTVQKVDHHEHVWGWVREEVTANTCFGTVARVRAHVDPFLAGLVLRTEEVKRRCRTVLQANADALDAVSTATAILHQAHQERHADAVPTLALV
jgi:hypothetical protein